MALLVGEVEAVIGVDDSKVDSGLNRTEGKFKGFAKKAAVIGAAVGTALAAGAVANINIEAANDKLAAQLALTGPESARIGKIAGGLYRDAYGGSIEEVNTAVGAVMSSIKGMANASGKDLESASAKALDFATTFDIDVSRAVQSVGTLINTGLAKDATEGFDLITAASNKVPAALREDVLDASDEYGQFFSSLGFDGQQAFAMLADASDKGVFGIDKIGDAVKEFTIRSTDMSTGSRDAFKAIGLDARTMANDILAGGDTAQGATQKIIDGLLGIKDPSKQAEAAIALFGTPLEDLNTAEIPAFLRSLTGASNTMDGFAGASKRSGDTLNENTRTSFESAKRHVAGFVQDLTKMEGPLGFAAAAVSELGPAALSAVAPIGVMIAAQRSAAAASVAAGATQKASMLSTAATAVAAAARQVAAWALLGVQALLHAAKVAAAWLIAMGPIGIVIAAVIGLVALIIANWDRIKVVITTVWNAIKSVTMTVWNAIKSALAAVWGAIKAVVTAHVNAVKAVVSAVWNAIKTVASTVWRAIVAVVRTHIAIVMAVINGIAAIPGKVAAWFGRAKSAAIEKLSALISWMRGLPGRLLSALGNLGRLLFNAGKDILTGLWNGIKSMGSFIKDKIIGLVSSIIPGPVKSILGIASPSKLFHEFGVNIGQGLALGIDSQTVAVASASERLARAAASPMQKAKAEMLRHLKRGGKMFEDFSFRGDSALVGRFNDRIADQFFASGAKFNRSSVERFLSGGGMTVNGPLIGEVKTMGSRLSLGELQKDLAMQGAA